MIGLLSVYYSDVRAGSSEGLLKKLHGMSQKHLLMRSLLIDLDEWKHLFDKAGIEHSSFATFMQTAFYKRHQNVTLRGGAEAEVDCQITMVGGIVLSQFDECFGPQAMGGLHDRFTFGLAPESYMFMYEPFEGYAEETSPIEVKIDRDVYEMIKALRKSDQQIGREAEIAVRIAHVCVLFDGRKILRAKDCEASVRAFITEQVRIRKLLKPNEGLTNDAVAANSLVSWLKQHAADGRVVSERDVRHGLRRMILRLGPECACVCNQEPGR